MDKDQRRDINQCHLLLLLLPPRDSDASDQPQINGGRFCFMPCRKCESDMSGIAETAVLKVGDVPSRGGCYGGGAARMRPYKFKDHGRNRRICQLKSS